MSDTLKPILATVADGASLSVEQSEAAFDIIMSGEATAAQIGAFLMALRVRGETVNEITGAVSIMRRKALKVSAPKNAIDIVGTGGDNSGTYNISTAAALVTAACGVPLAKHGNRSLSSKSGASDVLSSIGVNIDAPLDAVENAIKNAGIGFLMAPLYHSAMRFVGPARVEMGTRTIFNLLGPLSNPAGVTRQFTGVYSRQWVEPFAEVLNNLGCARAWIVHGLDGLDELTTTAPSFVAELDKGVIKTFEITPEDAGLPRAQPKDLIGGDGPHNAKALMRLLEGEKNAYRDVVLLNSAAALIVADKVSDLKDGVSMAATAIDDGRALAGLNKLVAITNNLDNVPS